LISSNEKSSWTFLVLRNISERSKLANHSIGISIGRSDNLINSAIGKGIFPLHDFPIYNIGQFTDLPARAIKVVQMLVAMRANTLPEISYHARVHIPYPVVRASNQYSVYHSLQYSQHCIALAPQQSLERLTPFRLATSKVTYSTGNDNKKYHSQQWVREGRYKKSTKQADTEGNKRNDYGGSDPEEIASIDYWHQEKEAMYIMHTVEDIPAQGFPAGEVHQFPKVVEQGA